MTETKHVVWADLLAEAETLRDGIADLVMANTSRRGLRVVDENGEEVTMVSWADRLRVPHGTLKGWVQRRRTSGTTSRAGTEGGSLGTAERAIRAVAKTNPAALGPLVAEAIRDNPEVADMVAHDAGATAALSNVERHNDRTREHVAGVAPALAVHAALATIRRDVKERLLPAAEQVGAGLSPTERDAATDVLAQIRAGLDLAESLLRSGDWDSALAEMLEA